MYSHDQDLAGWFVRDVIENKHLRLIGQETSTQGIFIGPFYYYLLTFFYALARMDPIGGIYLVTLLGLLTIFSIYWVFTKVFSKTVGYIGSFLYSASYFSVFNDREVVPTMPVFLWTVWFLYSLHLILKGKQKTGLLLAGLLIGLIWHLNFALVLISWLVVVALVISRKKAELKSIIIGVLTFFGTSIPLIFFELRHNFIQSKSLVTSLTTSQNDVISGFQKFERVIEVLNKNFTGFLWGDFFGGDYSLAGLFLLVVFVFLYFKKILKKDWGIILLLWISSYIAFFSLYSKIISEYYLNGTVVVALLLVSLFLAHIYLKANKKLLVLIILVLFSVLHIHKLLTININRSGYVYRRALIREIKSDAISHGYPCVSVSYITDPGHNFGYRYLFYLENLHVNKPDSGSPPYTIVFPLKDDLFPVGKTFGALGLIYPDYGKYDEAGVTISCSGSNSNLTDPLWGFTN